LFILLLIPAVVWFAAFTIAPVLAMFYLSLAKWNSLLDPIQIIGLKNFIDMLANPHFASAVRNTMIQIAVTIPCVLLASFYLGYFLSLRMPGHRVLRLLYFAPSMLSIAAVAMIFQGFLSSDGAVNGILRGFGMGDLANSWLVKPETAFASVILIDMWASVGFYAVLFFAALSGIPHELYEAARLEGAGHIDLMRHIAFPSAKRFVVLAAMLLFLYLLVGNAPNVLLLTQGGPGDLSTTVGYYLYQQAFSVQKYGYSQAVGVFTLVVGVIGLAAISRFGGDRRRRRVEAQP